MGKADGVLVLEAPASAPPGVYTCVVQASAAYNGQPLSVREDLTLTIEPAVPGRK
jgi:hypothetical protein